MLDSLHSERSSHRPEPTPIISKSHSLRDFQMTHLHLRRPPLPVERRRPPPLASDHFEFLHCPETDMCAADDIFLRGQLLPTKPKTPPTPTPITSTAQSQKCPSIHPSPRRKGPAIPLRGSLSADCKKLQTVPEERETSQSPTGRSAGSPTGSLGPAWPKWYMVVFGTVSVPAEMEMRDLKSRQMRRNPSVPVAGGDCDEGCRSHKVGRGSGSWKLLRTLGCRGDMTKLILSTFGCSMI